MAILVFSSSKPRVTAPERAHRCIIAAISRISANEKAGLRWVLLYVPSLLPFFFSSPILFVRTGYHKSQSEPQFHYTVRGFGKDGFAVKTIHVYSVTRSKVFRNGGTVWKLGGRRLDFQKECENLK